MADPEVEEKLRSAASQNGLYVPSGALWGGEDIRKMADRGTLQVVAYYPLLFFCLSVHSSASISSYQLHQMGGNFTHKFLKTICRYVFYFSCF